MTDYELIVCIVNAGFSETVMTAAKEQGARGGTVIHARGTAAKEAEEIFHITIQPEKEIVLIVVPQKIRDSVLHAVYQQAGLKTAGQGISFSMPVTNTVGLASTQPPVVPARPEKEQPKEAAEDKAKPDAREQEKEPKKESEEETKN
ncbi:MAG: hypothetical protein J1F33_04650 [Clostridiales bacterium]|nr:hypothetical protein [Clostridiales bacterium]